MYHPVVVIPRPYSEIIGMCSGNFSILHEFVARVIGYKPGHETAGTSSLPLILRNQGPKGEIRIEHIGRMGPYLARFQVREVNFLPIELSKMTALVEVVESLHPGAQEKAKIQVAKPRIFLVPFRVHKCRGQSKTDIQCPELGREFQNIPIDRAVADRDPVLSSDHKTIGRILSGHAKGNLIRKEGLIGYSIQVCCRLLSAKRQYYQESYETGKLFQAHSRGFFNTSSSFDSSVPDWG